MRVSILLLIALSCSVALLSVQGRESGLIENDGALNTTAMFVPDENSEILFTQIWRELEARNFTRPQHDGLLRGGHYGVDISQPCSKATWQCIRGKGQEFAVVRQYQEICRVDPNGVHSVANAWAGGMKHVDIYLFPSARCATSAAGQVDAAINAMGKVPFGQLWFDIEVGSGHWHKGHADNIKWLQAAVARAKTRLGAGRVGIYSSAYMWPQLMGTSSAFKSLPLWYAHYDNKATFSDFKSFGGWSKPAIKQFNDGPTLCNFGVDRNYYN